MAQTATIKLNEIERLRGILANLEIRVSAATDGSSYTVCTVSEPLFCFVRRTKEELQTVVIDTLTSYVTSFWQVDSVDVTATSVPPAVSAIPVEELKPDSVIKPTFRVRDSQGRQLEFA